MSTAPTEELADSTLHFHDYTLENVYLRTTPPKRAEIIALWREEEAIEDPLEAERRSHEAVLLVRSATGELAGLSTVGFMRVKDGRTFYAFRMFLQKRHRVPYLMLQVVVATRDFLKGFCNPVLQPAGILHVNENPKLMRPGARKMFERIGYRYWGVTRRGEDVWAMEFAEQRHHPNGSPERPLWRRALESISRTVGFGRRSSTSAILIESENLGLAGARPSKVDDSSSPSFQRRR